MVGKDSYSRDLVSGQSARLVCGYVYANAGEGESTQDLVFGGQNMIAENGVILAEGKRFQSATGKSHSPSEQTIGLFNITPSPIRTGADHCSALSS